MSRLYAIGYDRHVKYAALLFDLDGTLVNSIDLYGDAVIASMKEIGDDFSKEAYRDWYIHGQHLRQLLEKYGKTEEEWPDVRGDRDRRYIELLKEKVAWCVGAKETLEYFSGKIPMALVTGSWMEYVDASDGKLDLKKYFQTIVTVDDIGKFTKPHPHSLLLAADRLGFDSKECLYIGDQLFDVVASKAAGMPCCIVKGAYTPKEAMEQADFVVKNLAALRDLVSVSR